MRIGSRGWRYREWAGIFYPEDLPKDWQLSYYSNEFDTVLVPSTYLQSARVSDVSNWLDDSHEDFAFFTELDVRNKVEKQIELSKYMQPQLAGVVVKSQNPLAENDVDYLLSQFGNDIKLYLPYGSMVSKKWQEADNLGTVRDVLVHAPSAKAESVGFIDKVQLTPKELRALISTQLAHNAATRGLFVSGQIPSIELLRRAKAIQYLIS